MLKPRALAPGDRIALVSPASPFSREQFDKGLEELRRLGYEPTYHESVFDRSLFTSGPPALRAASIEVHEVSRERSSLSDETDQPPRSHGRDSASTAASRRTLR